MNFWVWWVRLVGVRIVIVAFLALISSSTQALPPEEMRARAIANYPGLVFSSVERAVAKGTAPLTATTKYGDPPTQKHGTTLVGTHTVVTSWPEAGVYRQIDGKLLGVKYVTERPQPSFSVEREFLMFDGAKRYMHLEGSSRDQVHVVEPGQRMYDSSVVEVWDSYVGILEPRSTRIDPRLGKILVFEANGRTSEVAVERDWMLVKRYGRELDMEVTGFTQVAGKWLPTEVKSSRMGIDIYCSASYKLAPKLVDGDFTPKTNSKTLWIEDNVYYVVVGGKLVKSARQPDRTSEYLSWLGIGATAIVIFGVLAHQAHKLFGKSNGSIFGDNEGTSSAGNDV